MEWFAFLFYFLIATFSSLALWFTIKIGFRNTVPYELESAESTKIRPVVVDPSIERTRLSWNFSSTLLIIPTLLLVLGIAVRTSSISDPVTWVPGVALILIWFITLWTKMLSFQKSVPVFSPDKPEPKTVDMKAVPQTTERKPL